MATFFFLLLVRHVYFSVSVCVTEFVFATVYVRVVWFSVEADNCVNVSLGYGVTV